MQAEQSVMDCLTLSATGWGFVRKEGTGNEFIQSHAMLPIPLLSQATHGQIGSPTPCMHVGQFGHDTVSEETRMLVLLWQAKTQCSGPRRLLSFSGVCFQSKTSPQTHLYWWHVIHQCSVLNSLVVLRKISAEFKQDSLIVSCSMWKHKYTLCDPTKRGYHNKQFQVTVLKRKSALCITGVNNVIIRKWMFFCSAF